MLDINLFRVDKGGNPEHIKESQRKRWAPESDVDSVIELDKQWIKLRFEVDQFNKQINAVQKSIGLKFRAKEDASELVQQKDEIVKHRGEVEALMAAKEAERDDVLKRIGNLVHESVPVSDNEDNNAIVREFMPEGMTALRSKEADLLAHDQVLDRIGGYDPDRGSKVAGHRGFFLLDAGIDLNQALISYGLNFLKKREYTKIMTPFFMRKDMMARTAQLSQFDEELYKVVEKERDAAARGKDEAEEYEDKYLIATSEQPISCFHANELFDRPEKQLPLKYAGYSTCFRKEAGTSGRDTWGIFRIHQFEKIEQFCLTEPEHSWDMFNHMIQNSEEFYQSLGLPYRLVSIVSGALNNAAAKKYDLEAWFPYQQAYKELVSCSNCTDYQSRRLEIRCGVKKAGTNEKRYVHLLNSTLTATERTICCILENYQDPVRGGVRVPEVLVPYMGGQEFLPYIAPVRKHKVDAA